MLTLKEQFSPDSVHQPPTWLLSTLYPYLRAKIRPSEMAMPYPTTDSAKASPIT